MRAMNYVCVEGNLAKDATLRKKKDGTAVLAFTIAQTNLRRNRATGKTISAPYHFQCTYFGDRAEKLLPALTKGTAVMVTGSLRNSEWVRDGEKRYQVDILVRQVTFEAPLPAKAAPAAKARPGKVGVAAPEAEGSEPIAAEAPDAGMTADVEPTAQIAPAEDAFGAEPEDDWPFDFDFDAFEEEE